MRDFLDLIQRQWQLFVSAPAVALATVVLSFALGLVIAKAMYGAVADTARERLQAAKEELERLRGQKDTLLARLDAHGEDITALKRQMDAQPKHFVSDRPPGPNDVARDGDVWFQIASDAAERSVAADVAARPPSGGSAPKGPLHS